VRFRLDLIGMGDVAEPEPASTASLLADVRLCRLPFQWGHLGFSVWLILRRGRGERTRKRPPRGLVGEVAVGAEEAS